MGQNKKYSIDSDKCRKAEEWGWTMSIEEDNGALLSGAYKDNPKMVKFVKDRLPKLLSDFYNKILEEATDDGIDEDYITEAAEEFIAPDLGSMLVWLVGQVDPDALKEEKQEEWIYE